MSAAAAVLVNRTSAVAPVMCLTATGSSRAVLVCDHAGRYLPPACAGLGLPVAATWQHMAFDLGAADLTRRLAAELGAPAVLGTHSRLLIDLNRAADAPDLIPECVDGVAVPGNGGLDAGTRAARLAAWHTPYHAALAQTLATAAVAGPVALVAIHSFTPVMQRRHRPWAVGVLWDRDERIALPLLQALRAQNVGAVGENEPYSGRHPGGYTLRRHAAPAAIAHVCLEMRQDELLTPAARQRWAQRLAAALRPTLDRLGVQS